MDVFKETDKKMRAVIDHLKRDLKGLRTGRANPAMLDHVMVEVYGTQMRLHDMASLSVPEPRQLLVQPFDAHNVHAIAKAVEAANLNVQPIIDGNVVRIKVPEMDQAVRQEMVKQARRKCEEAKVGIRNVRREGNELVKKLKAEGDLSEDGVRKEEKKIQELTDKFCKEADHEGDLQEAKILEK